MPRKTIAYWWEKIDQQFVTEGFQPHTYVLYNEVSNTLKKSFEKYTVNYQLLPPHSHRENKSERSIRNFKDHFKAVFDTLDPDFPIAHWGIMLTQAVITMKISVYTYIFGDYNFNTTPISPPSIKVVVHSNPDQLLTWDLNV